MAVYTESWNKANSTTLGPDLAWTEVGDDSEVVGNAWRPVTINGSIQTTARANQDLGSVDHYAQCVVTTLSMATVCATGICVRYADAAHTYYSFYAVKSSFTSGSENGHWRLSKFVAGVETTLTEAHYTWANTDLFRVEATGASPVHLVCKLNGTTVSTYDDSTSPLSTQTKCGVTGYMSDGDDCRQDSFEMGTISVVTSAFVSSAVVI